MVGNIVAIHLNSYLLSTFLDILCMLMQQVIWFVKILGTSKSSSFNNTRHFRDFKDYSLPTPPAKRRPPGRAIFML